VAISSSGLRDRLLAFLAGRLPGRDLNDSTPLVTSGLIDSLALIDLVAWMEQEVGAAIDLAAIENPATEWNTVRDIVTFVADRHDKVLG
jgi:acyl carrier protein